MVGRANVDFALASTKGTENFVDPDQGSAVVRPQKAFKGDVFELLYGGHNQTLAESLVASSACCQGAKVGEVVMMPINNLVGIEP